MAASSNRRTMPTDFRVKSIIILHLELQEYKENMESRIQDLAQHAVTQPNFISIAITGTSDHIQPYLFIEKDMHLTILALCWCTQQRMAKDISRAVTASLLKNF